MNPRSLSLLLAAFFLPSAGAAAMMPPRQLEIYERAGVSFASAFFYKPAEVAGAGLEFALAPMLLQEAEVAAAASQPGVAPRADAFGTLAVSNRVLTLDKSHPAVYYEADIVELGGRTHARFTYVWCYSLSRKAGKAGGLPMQGVRITLDSNGNPAIWEILADRSGLEPVFVAQSLEEAARAQFGPPLKGRRYSVEGSLAEARNALVARVIDDGPVPMGPMVYLDDETHSAATLICRCMPAQARGLADTRVYDLIPASMAPRESLLMRARHTSGSRPAFWPGARTTDARLQKLLRLPDRF